MKAGAVESKERFMTLAEVADRIGQSERQVKSYRATGRLKVHKFGKSVRVSPEDFRDFIESFKESR